LPAAVARDWIQGNTIHGFFERVAVTPLRAGWPIGPLRKIEPPVARVGAAPPLLALPDGLRDGTERPALNFMKATRIILEVVRQADHEGVVARSEWVTAVRTARARLSPDRAITRSGLSDEADSFQQLAHYLGDHVLSRACQEDLSGLSQDRTTGIGCGSSRRWGSVVNGRTRVRPIFERTLLVGGILVWKGLI
jgi:hypothetical protein